MTRRIAMTKTRRRRVKFNTGKWTDAEKKLFLVGLRKFGKGRWKEIATTLTTRSAVQIKSHGQKLLYRAERGEDIFVGIYDSRGMECGSDDELSSMQHVSESEDDEFTEWGAHTDTNNQKDNKTCDFEDNLATPKSLQNSTILYQMVMVKAPIKKPLGRLSSGKAFVNIQSSFRSPVTVCLNDSWPGTESLNRDVMAATALMSLSSLSCDDHSPSDMSCRFNDIVHATKNISYLHGEFGQIHKI